MIICKRTLFVESTKKLKEGKRKRGRKKREFREIEIERQVE